MELDRHSHGRRRSGTKHLSGRVPCQGRDEGFPSGGLSGKGRDADGDEVAFMAQTYPGRCDNLGGGKPPTSNVLTMRHAGPVPVPKWETQEHRDV